VDRCPLGVADERDGARLALESRTLVRIRRELGGRHLQRDVAVQALVEGAADDAHAAATELAVDAERPDAQGVRLRGSAPRSRARGVDAAVTLPRHGSSARSGQFGPRAPGAPVAPGLTRPTADPPTSPEARNACKPGRARDGSVDAERLDSRLTSRHPSVSRTSPGAWCGGPRLREASRARPCRRRARDADGRTVRPCSGGERGPPRRGLGAGLRWRHGTARRGLARLGRSASVSTRRFACRSRRGIVVPGKARRPRGSRRGPSCAAGARGRRTRQLRRGPANPHRNLRVGTLASRAVRSPTGSGAPAPRARGRCPRRAERQAPHPPPALASRARRPRGWQRASRLVRRGPPPRPVGSRLRARSSSSGMAGCWRPDSPFRHRECTGWGSARCRSR